MDSPFDSYNYAEQGLPPEQIGGGNSLPSTSPSIRLSRIIVPTFKASPSSYATAKIRNTRRMQDNEDHGSIDTEGPLEPLHFNTDDDKENATKPTDTVDDVFGPVSPSSHAVTPPITAPTVREDISCSRSPPALSMVNTTLPSPPALALEKALIDSSSHDVDHDQDSDSSSDPEQNQPKTPRGKPGRRSEETQRKTEELFTAATELFEKAAGETGRSIEALIQDWGHSIGSPVRKASTNAWNLYERYFSDPVNRATERQRVGKADADSKFIPYA